MADPINVTIEEDVVEIIEVGQQGPAGPDGDAGADGVAGIAFDAAGWVAATSYTERAALEHNGSCYYCIVNHVAGASTEPGVGADWSTVWALLAGGAVIIVSDTAPADPVTGRFWAQPLDTEAPVVTAFTIPATSAALLVSITALTATDNRAVTGYYVSESPTTPGVGQSGWSETPPTEWTFSGQGARTLYAWAKDAAGNVSNPASDSVTITLPNQAPAASVAATNQSPTGFTAAGVVYGIGTGDTLTKIRVAWMLQGVDVDPAAAVAAGRYTDLTAGADLTAYQGSGKAISATLAVGSYTPAVQVTENMSGGGSQTGEWVTGAAFIVTLTAPTGVVCTAGNTQNTITWNAVSGATSYDIYWLSGGASPTKATGTKITGVTSPHVHSSLTNGETYKYVVVAVNSGGESVESAVVTGVPAIPVLTWNSADKSTKITLETVAIANDRAAHNADATWNGVRGTLSASSGLRYAEFLLTGNNACAIGVAKAEATLENFVGADAHGWGWVPYSSRFYNNGNYTAAGTISSFPARVGMLWDPATGKLWFKLNGAPATTDTPAFASGVVGTLFPVCSLYQNTPKWQIIQQANWLYTPPVGAVSW